jgi:hypothetical protein
MSRFPWETCIITTPEGETYPGYISRGGHKDANDEYEFFEASRVFPYEYRGEEVLVDIDKAKEPFRVFTRRKNGEYKTKKGAKNPKTGGKDGQFSAIIVRDHRDVYTYMGHTVPDELITNPSESALKTLKEIEEKELEFFLSGKVFGN